MKRSSLSIAAAVLGSITAACASIPPASANEEERLMETSREWARAAESGNVDAIVRYWADDAVVIMPGSPTFSGKDAIRAYVAQSMDVPGFRITWEPIAAQVSQSGDMGYLIERTEVTAPGPSGEVETHELRAVTIWRREPDGSWRNVVDIATPAEEGS